MENNLRDEFSFQHPIVFLGSASLAVVRSAHRDIQLNGEGEPCFPPFPPGTLSLVRLSPLPTPMSSACALIIKIENACRNADCLS